jgi:membrane-associated PAP2 superfamily phosphatase
MSQGPTIRSNSSSSSVAASDSLGATVPPVHGNGPLLAGANENVSAEPAASLAAFWWRHIRVPLALFAILTPFFAFTQADLKIADAVFFNSAHHDWMGAGSWWTNQVIHEGGTWFVRLLVLAAFAVAAWGTVDPRLKGWRKPALYFAVSVILSVGCVGALKTVTNKDCPRDLTEFGGDHAYVPLFAHRPPELRNARCFPAAHASAGYSLLALYFMFRGRNRRWGRMGLAVGVLTGLIFGISQQSRGAHFVSHDVWSAFIVWTVALSTYVGLFRARLWRDSAELRAD